MCLTGNGATFALSAIAGGATPPTSVGRVISIPEREEMLPVIDDDDLASTAAEKCPGDFDENAPQDIGVVFDPDTYKELKAARGTPFIGTLTYPLQAGQSTPASETGSGFLIGGSRGQMVNNERTEGMIRWVWDNKSTPKTETASVAA